MSAGSGEERRRQPRVEYVGTGVAMIGRNRIPCRGRDLSRGGVSVRGRWNAYPGQSVTIELSIEGERVDVFGAVAWSAPDGDAFTWGVRFTAVHARCRRFIDAYVGAKLEGQRRSPLREEDAPIEPSRLPTSEMVLDSATDEERMPTIDAAISAAALEDAPAIAEDDDGLLDFDDMPTLVFSRRSKELKERGVVRRRKPRPTAEPFASTPAPVGPAAASASVPAMPRPEPEAGWPSPVPASSTVPVQPVHMDMDPYSGMPAQAWDSGPSAFASVAATPQPPTVDVSGFSVPLPPELDEPPGGTEVAGHIPHAPAPVVPVAAAPLPVVPSQRNRTWPVLPPQSFVPAPAPERLAPEPARPPKMAATMILDPVADFGTASDDAAGEPPRDPNEPFDLRAQRRRRIEEILAKGKRRTGPAAEEDQTPTEETPSRAAKAPPPEPEPVQRPKMPSAPQQPVDFSAEVKALYEAALRQLD